MVYSCVKLRKIILHPKDDSHFTPLQLPHRLYWSFFYWI